METEEGRDDKGSQTLYDWNKVKQIWQLWLILKDEKTGTRSTSNLSNKIHIHDKKRQKKEPKVGFIRDLVITWKSEGIEVYEEHGRNRAHHGGTTLVRNWLCNLVHPVQVREVSLLHRQCNHLSHFIRVHRAVKKMGGRVTQRFTQRSSPWQTAQQVPPHSTHPHPTYLKVLTEQNLSKLEPRNFGF